MTEQERREISEPEERDSFPREYPSIGNLPVQSFAEHRGRGSAGHGGSIEADSRPGEFTEFTIRLPRQGRAVTSEAAG